MRPTLLALLLSLSTLAGCASGTAPSDGGPRPDVPRPDAQAQRCSADAECDDGNACNGSETCASGLCAPGTLVSCDDSQACTVDSCNPADGACTHMPDDSLCGPSLVCDATDGCIAPLPCETDADCDDGVFCNGTSTCDPAFGCRNTPVDCGDGFDCTVDSCDTTADACIHTADDTVCDDGLVCNGDETCDTENPDADGMGCVIGTSPVCDDGIDCTMDVCDETAGGCSPVPDHAACADGVFCNGAEQCVAGTGCQPGTAPDCADAVGCTVGRCDAAMDTCVQDANDAACQDGRVCNGNERCDVTGTTPGMGCVAGAPFDCSDGLACTTDICDEPGTCRHGGSDADMDGYTAVGCGTGNDCNDLSAAIRPGATELCDGVDNDCSGSADDGTGMECALGSAPAACTTSCGTPGRRACNSACRLGPCVAMAESCNDCDDDGDGLADNGLTCRRNTSTSCVTSCGTSGSRTCASDCSGYGACAAAFETCNDCDDDGDGLVDDGLPCRRGTSASCTTTCGTTGARVCAVDCSGYGSCRATEVCNGCDDDNDGAPDNGFACRQGQTQSCTTSCGTVGVRTCASDCSGFGACVATEVCNGCDDDADGTIDDGFTCTGGSTQSCTTSCGTTGTRACNGSCSGYGACTATEACNGCDDDGDGTSDEDFACRQGATMGCNTSCGTAGTRTCNSTCTAFGACAAAEVCNGCDDDGVGGADNGFTCVQGSSRSCTTGCGTTGTQSCNGSCTGYGTCSATEVCNGCDDDGVGGPDNGFACVRNATQGCTTGCGTAGTQTCNGTCSAYGSCAGTEVCNNCDDDGNGVADNGFTCAQGTSRSCTTACGTSGSQTCNGTCSAYGTCLAPAEICGNGCDDNGNGQTDEGCGPANDQCAGAITISGATGSHAGTLVGATAQVSDCGTGVENFYVVTVTQPAIVYLSTVGGATFDTRLSYRGAACGGTSVQCVDDSCGSLQTHLAQLVTPGSPHYFAVHTFSSSTTPGAYTLAWRLIPTTAGAAVHVPDDDLAGAGTVQTYSGTTTSSGTLVPTNPATTCGFTSSGASGENLYYWAQCASDNRNYTASLCTGTSYDTTAWVRFNGSQVACNDDSCGLQSSVTATGVGGAGVVEVLVDGYGSSSGAYTLTLTL
ncbi:MAG: putative metal-binding motif-containing protein [Sandaracinaceae bacterium]|nr:putative metal-binding motif-containing protein [Sandaracinaceae bacterium]